MALSAHDTHTFLGLLAKIKCSICSLEFDNSNGGHCLPCYLIYFSGGLLNSSACTAESAAWPWHCTTALAEHPLNKSIVLSNTLQDPVPHACRIHVMQDASLHTSSMPTLSTAIL